MIAARLRSVGGAAARESAVARGEARGGGRCECASLGGLLLPPTPSTRPPAARLCHKAPHNPFVGHRRRTRGQMQSLILPATKELINPQSGAHQVAHVDIIRAALSRAVRCEVVRL